MPVVKETEIRGQGVRRRLYGHLLTLHDGTLIYMARRKWREVYRGGKASISGAMQEEKASWAIDEKLLVGLRAKGVRFIGVRVIDTGDYYLTRTSAYFDRKQSKLIDYTGVGKGGSRQRIVSLGSFTVRKGIASLDVAL